MGWYILEILRVQKTRYYLETLLQSDNSMSIDIAQKRGKYIGKVNSLLQEFHFVNPDIMTKLVNVYATSFYGSGTWYIFSTSCEKLYKSWNITIRQIFNLEWSTHRYLIEHISGCLHLKVMLVSRYITFYKTLISSSKIRVSFLSRLIENDIRTVLGRTLQSIKQQCEVKDESSNETSYALLSYISQCKLYLISFGFPLFQLHLGSFG